MTWLKCILILSIVGSGFAGELFDLVSNEESVECKRSPYSYNMPKFDPKCIKVYESTDILTDLPKTFKNRAPRPFGRQWQCQILVDDIIPFTRTPGDIILIWLQGKAAEVNIINRKTKMVEKLKFNKRSPIHVIPANTYFSMKLRKSETLNYAVFKITEIIGLRTKEYATTRRNILLKKYPGNEAIITEMTK